MKSTVATNGTWKHGDAVKGKEYYLYSLWLDIKKRCLNKNSTNYNLYGGRGIKMDKRWVENYPLFKKEIIASIGHKPFKSYSIDRIDCNGNYEINNLRWASKSLQGSNKRSLKNRSSGLTGITFKDGSWVARIAVEGKRYHLIQTKCILKAIMTYEEIHLEWFGDVSKNLK